MEVQGSHSAPLTPEVGKVLLITARQSWGVLGPHWAFATLLVGRAGLVNYLLTSWPPLTLEEVASIHVNTGQW